jgi:hypothetical protein
MSGFKGKYKWSKNENFDDYVNIMELPFPAKYAMKNSAPNVTISQDDDGQTWEVAFRTMGDFIKIEMKFKLGEEFEEKPPFGGPNKAVATVEGDALKIVAQTAKGELVRIFRLNNGGKELEIEMKCDAKGAQAKRFFERTE